MIILALAVLASQAATQAATPFELPKASTDAPTPDFLNWAGFGYLPSTDRAVSANYPGAGDWSGIQSGQGGATAISVPVKFLVIHRIDEIRTLPDGTLYEEQPSLESPDIARIRRTADLLTRIVDAETNGALKLTIDVSVEDDPVIQKGRSLEQIATDFCRPRFNGGSFNNDDKVYRGPYFSVFCFEPDPTPITKYLTVNGTPLALVSSYGDPGYESDGVFAARIANVWTTMLEQRAKAVGILGPLAAAPAVNSLTGLKNPQSFLAQGQGSLFACADAAVADIDANLKLKTADSAAISGAGKLFTPVYKGPDNEIKFGTDPDRGGVLIYSEKGTSRTGELDFPDLSANKPVIDVSKTPTLDFWVKSTSPDPMGLRFTDASGQQAVVCLGLDRPGPIAVKSVAFSPDGSWHMVKIDLKQTGFGEISHVAVAPTPNSLQNIKQTLGPIEFDFAGFKATSDQPDGPQPAVTADPDSSDPWARAIWAHAATPSPKLLTLLSDPAWFVRLNALQHYIEHPDPAAEPALTQVAAGSIDGPVGAAAVLALWKLGDDSAKQAVHQYIRTGVTEQGRSEAATLIAEQKDPESAAELISLQQARTVYTRMDAVRALALIPGHASATIRATFLFLEDAETKLVVSECADPNDEDQVRKLLWSAVNEPSDAVRVACDTKLLQSNAEATRKEGLKGIKDDSTWVRVALLQYVTEHPGDEYRDTILLGVADKSARVRAAALTALAAQLKPVTIEDLGDSASDGHPEVELALLELKLKKGIKLSDGVLDHMRASADPRIQAALREGSS